MYPHQFYRRAMQHPCIGRCNRSAIIAGLLLLAGTAAIAQTSDGTSGSAGSAATGGTGGTGSWRKLYSERPPCGADAGPVVHIASKEWQRPVHGFALTLSAS
jgi:hypothetical protein